MPYNAALAKQPPNISLLCFMLSEKEATRLSKFLSFVLRHQPQTIGLTLDENGWADVTGLLQKLKTKGFNVDRTALQHVVATNNKKRFAFNEDETKIRASQGHSINVALGLEESIPPAILYHGTAQKNTAAILQKGLLKQSRQHVHVSKDVETAINVGKRHGVPVVFEVRAEAMLCDGHAFYLSANGVWLTETVPAKYLRLLSS